MTVPRVERPGLYYPKLPATWWLWNANYFRFMLRELSSVFIALLDRKSTRLNSSHSQISYAVFCLKKKKKQKSQRGQSREGSLIGGLMQPVSRVTHALLHSC